MKKKGFDPTEQLAMEDKLGPLWHFPQLKSKSHFKREKLSEGSLIVIALFWSNISWKSFSSRFNGPLFTFSFPFFFFSLEKKRRAVRWCWVSSGYVFPIERDHCWLHSHPSIRTHNVLPEEAFLNDSVRYNPKLCYIVKAGMKFGLDNITSPQMNAWTFHAGSGIVRLVTC